MPSDDDDRTERSGPVPIPDVSSSSDSPPPPAGPAVPAAADETPPEAGSKRSAMVGGVWNAASSVLPLASTLALSVVISRELGAEVLGQQSVVAYVGSLMVSVLIFSFTLASVQLLASASGARDDDRLAWLSRWSFGAHLVGGVVAAGIMVGAGLGRAEYSSLWYLGAATALVDALGWAYASRSIARRGWGPTASRRLVAQAVSPLAAIVAVYLGWGVQGVFVMQLVVAAVLLVVLSRLDRDVVVPTTRGRRAPARGPVLRLWTLFALSALITQVVDRRLELVFLDYFHDARTVAMYSVAFNLVGIPTTLAASLVGAAMPAIATRHASDPASVLPALGRAARVVVTIQLMLAAGTITVGPGLVEAAYGSEFADAGTQVRWLGITLLVVPLGHLFNALWIGIGTLRPVLLAGGCGAVVDLVLAWLLIPSLAATGAVVATASAQLVSAAVVITYTVRHGMRLDLRWRRIALTAMIALLAGAAAAAATGLVTGLPGVLAAVVAFVVVAGLGARFLGILDEEDMDWLSDTLPGPARRVVRALSPSR